MRVLIDECIRWRFGSYLVGHECVGVVKAGLAGKTNGILMRLAEQAGYDVFLTVDQGIAHQQQIRNRSIGLIVICAVSNKIEALLPHVPACLEALRSIRPGQVVTLD